MSLTKDEERLMARMAPQLSRYTMTNKRQWGYYDGDAPLKNLNIAVPQTLASVQPVIGWPEIIVDALHERIEWQGWSSTTSDVSGLERVFRDNQLETEFAKASLDSLVTGVGFLAVGAGDATENEPDVVVTAVPSTEATFIWDQRRNRVASGYTRQSGADGEVIETLFTLNSTITKTTSGSQSYVERVDHHRGRCGLVAIPNIARAGSFKGRSEITLPIRYYTDHGMRTILGMEYNREIYTTPQRWLKNVLPEQLGLDESPSEADLMKFGWDVAQNRALLLPPPESDDVPPAEAGQFQSSPPTPYIEELRMLSQLVSAQSGVPSNYLGFVTETPPSADAIRVSESRLVKKAERRQTMFGQILRNDLAYLCQSILDGKPADPGFIASITVQWRDASTPTIAAATDAMVKARQAGFIAAGSDVALARMGFTPAERELIRTELRDEKASNRLKELTEAVRKAPSEAVELAKASRPVGDPVQEGQ